MWNKTKTQRNFSLFHDKIEHGIIIWDQIFQKNLSWQIQCVVLCIWELLEEQSELWTSTSAIFMEGHVSHPTQAWFTRSMTNMICCGLNVCAFPKFLCCIFFFFFLREIFAIGHMCSPERQRKTESEKSPSGELAKQQSLLLHFPFLVATPTPQSLLLCSLLGILDTLAQVWDSNRDQLRGSSVT